jgi:hypothetical protein
VRTPLGVLVSMLKAQLKKDPTLRTRATDLDKK